MRLLRTPITACLLTLSLSLAAQTYTPKSIRIEGVPDADAAEYLRIAALPSGPLTKQQIEAALQRLADTGVFTDISYTVNANALVIKLAVPATGHSLPARYANFVWWQPAELEPLVEARVPAFHGKLPFTGTLADQVEAALVALLHEKGITAQVTAMQSSDIPHGPVTSIALLITEPKILLGDVHLENESSALKPQLDERLHTLSSEDFDLVETATAIRENVADVYQNAGFLDIATDSPTFSPPRSSNGRYLIDATSTIRSGELYRIGRILLQEVPPVSQSDLNKAADIKTGNPASVLALRIAKGEVAKAYSDRGYLDASVDVASSKDPATHTVAYAFSIEPGEIYRLASVDASALTPSQQATFASAFKVAPGAVVDRDLTIALFRALAELHAAKFPKVNTVRDRNHHTAAIVITPAKPAVAH